MQFGAAQHKILIGLAKFSAISQQSDMFPLGMFAAQT
jgi:hypothetical protein